MKTILLALALLAGATAAHAEGSAESAFGDALVAYGECLQEQAMVYVDDRTMTDGNIADFVMGRFCKNQRSAYLRAATAHFGFKRENRRTLTASMDDSVWHTLIRLIRSARKERAANTRE